jgi:psp operon transcriptional activator
MTRNPEALGQSDIFLKTQERISQVARINRPVLITGERGTGKELAASRLHFLSQRWQNPFITLNCAALNPSVLESELFGHEAGAFTGATRQRKGRFEMAMGGTLFLDEIGNMPMIVQEKILRVIEYGSFERVGGSLPVSVDVRIIAATNANLPALVKSGLFKADLLDRLSFEVISLPPLRKRQEDIVVLAQHFASRMSIELGFDSPIQFSDQVLEMLHTYSWPGNIRELKNAIERAVYKNTHGTINSVTINPFDCEEIYSQGDTEDCQRSESDSGTVKIGSPRSFELPLDKQLPLPEMLAAIEKKYLENALVKCHYNQRKAAVDLGITYHQLRGLYRKHFSNDITDRT